MLEITHNRQFKPSAAFRRKPLELCPHVFRFGLGRIRFESGQTATEPNQFGLFCVPLFIEPVGVDEAGSVVPRVDFDCLK